MDWTHSDLLIEILTDPEGWFDLETIKTLLVRTLNYFAMMENHDVERLVRAMDNLYYNKSEEHHVLCQDIRYGLLVFQKMIQLDAKFLPNMTHNNNFRVKLRVAPNTLDLLCHWWNTALSMFSSSFENENVKNVATVAF